MKRLFEATGFILFWRGKAEFWPHLVLGLILPAAVVFLILSFRDWPLWEGPLGLMFLALPLIVIWQVVGTFRATSGMLGDPDGLIKTLAFFGLLIASVAVMVSSALGALSRNSIDPLLGKYVAPEVRVFPAPDGTILTLKGEIDHDLFDQFSKAITDQVQTVQIQSKGGNVFAARGIAKLITDKKLDTVAVGKCYSACTLAFLAGARRSLVKGGELGFHGYAFNAAAYEGADILAEQAKDFRFFVGRGVSAEFAAKAFATDHSDIWIPTPAELRKAGILDSP